MITICQSKITDIKNIMKYIGSNFKRTNHILSKNKKVINWLYYDKKKYKYNFLLAKKNFKQIVGLIGIIKNSHFQKNLFRDIIWFSPYHSLQSERINFSGIKLLKELKLRNKNQIIGTIGCNELAKKILEILGFKTGSLRHYYILNPEKKKYLICKIKSRPKILNFKQNEFKIKKKKLNKFNISKEELKRYERKFFKNLKYFNNKFTDNPFYKYSYYFIENKKKKYGFFVGRECKYKKNNVLRLVDYYGDINCLSKIGYELFILVTKNKYEYLDFYNYGIDKKLLLKSGFLVNNFNENIIPNYFEPFEKKNINLDFAIWPKKYKYFLFKGDCDQERPSI